MNLFCPKMISLLQKSLQICPKYMTTYTSFFDFCLFLPFYYVFFSLFSLLWEIRRVMSGKMASNQLKTLQKFDLDSFQGIA